MSTFKTVRSAREKAIALNSLICLLQGLIGERATVELRNESTVTGLILDVDIYMNVSMSDVSLEGPNSTLNLEAFYVRGKNIRFVFIPDHIDILTTIKKQVAPRAHKPGHHQKRENRYKIISNALAKQGTSKD